MTNLLFFFFFLTIHSPPGTIVKYHFGWRVAIIYSYQLQIDYVRCASAHRTWTPCCRAWRPSISGSLLARRPDPGSAAAIALVRTSSWIPRPPVFSMASRRLRLRMWSDTVSRAAFMRFCTDSTVILSATISVSSVPDSDHTPRDWQAKHGITGHVPQEGTQHRILKDPARDPHGQRGAPLVITEPARSCASPRSAGGMAGSPYKLTNFMLIKKHFFLNKNVLFSIFLCVILIRVCIYNVLNRKLFYLFFYRITSAWLV